MCGRYYIDDDTAREIEKLILELDQKANHHAVDKGEIYPTNKATILVANNNVIQPHIVKWGFPNFKNSGVIINARSETAFEKNLFRESLLSKRCIIPASGFHEWNKSKDKLYFTPQNQSETIMYMAGIYNTFIKEPRFVILTTNANSSISNIHDRMPLLLSKKDMNTWLLDNTCTQTFLQKTPYPLDKSAEFEQQQLQISLLQ